MRGFSTGRNGLVVGLLLLTVASAILIANIATVAVAENSGEGRLKKVVNILRSTPPSPPPPPEQGPLDNITRFVETVKEVLGNHSLLGELAARILHTDDQKEAEPQHNATLTVVEKLLGNGTLAHLFAGKDKHAEASPAEDVPLNVLEKLLGKGSLGERADTLRKHMSDVNRTVHLVLQLLA